MESPAMLVPTAHVVSPPPSLPMVHRLYLLLKAHYFLFFSAFGVLVPILNITLRSRGLSNAEISYINIVIPFLIFFINPLLGFVADRTRRYLSTFNIVLVVVTILYTIMFLLPTVKTNNIQADLIQDPKLGRVLDFCASQEVSTQCASRSQCGCVYQADCTSINQRKRFFFTFSMSSKRIYKEIEGSTGMSAPETCGIQYRVPIDEAIKTYTRNDHPDLFHRTRGSSQLAVCEITCSIPHYCHGSRRANQMRTILLYSIIYILATNLLSNAIPLGASIGFATLTNPDLFGQQRVFGTIGFGLAAFAASRIYGIFRTEFVYIIMFSITAIICIIVTSFIRMQPTGKAPSATHDETAVQEKEIDGVPLEKKKKKSQHHSSELLLLLKKVDVIVFLSLTFISGMSYAGLDPYLYLYIDEIAPCQSYSIIGWMSLVSATAEVIGFFFAARLIKLLGSNLSSIIILLAFTVRFGGYYYIRQPYFLITMESMHFFNFGVLYVLIAQKADSIAPAGLSGTLQGVALGVLYGLGRGIGLLIASLIYTLIEQRVLFLIISIFNLIAAMIYSIYFMLTRQRAEKNDNVVMENDTITKEEPLLMVSTKNQINEQ